MTDALADLERSVTDLRELLRVLALQMAQKGYRNASAEFHVASSGAPAIRLDVGDAGGAGPFLMHGLGWSWETIEAPTLAEVLTGTHRAIRDMVSFPNAGGFPSQLSPAPGPGEIPDASLARVIPGSPPVPSASGDGGGGAGVIDADVESAAVVLPFEPRECRGK